jgi:class 3 adenylate cyclase
VGADRSQEIVDADFTATIFVSCVVGYTSRCETMSPAEVTDWTNGIHQLVTDAVLAEDGVPVKYLGDGFLAYFDGEETERRAVRAALVARDLLNDKLAIGIATGPVHRSLIGHQRYARADIMGAAVNRAFRVEQWAAGSESRIAILWDDAQSLEEGYFIVRHDGVGLKGMPDAVRLFEVVGKRA